MSISDRIAIMRAGRIEQVGTPEEVYARPASTYVARFIGSPQMEILAGEPVSADGTDGYRVGTTTFPLPRAHAAALQAAPADLGIRPEHIALGTEGVPVTVRVVQPLGPMSHVTVGWDGGRLTARVPGMAHHRPGETVGLTLDPAHLLLFDRASGRRIDPTGVDHG